MRIEKLFLSFFVITILLATKLVTNLLSSTIELAEIGKETLKYIVLKSLEDGMKRFVK